MAGQWWSRDRSGRIRLRLLPEEAATILGLLAELREVLGGPVDSDVMQRLFPRAYLDPTEDDAEVVWRALAGPELVRDRLDRLDLLARALEPIALGTGAATLVLDEAGETAWLTALNDTRLALGTALGIHDDDEQGDDDGDDIGDGRDEAADLDPTDPAASATHLYHVLTYFQGELIDAVLGGMPTTGSDE